MMKMENPSIKLRLSIGVEFHKKPSFNSEVHMKRPAAASITIVGHSDGWYLARAEQGMEGWFRAEQDPVFHRILKRAAREYPTNLVCQEALDWLDHVVVGVWRNLPDRRWARERIRALLESVAVLQHLARDAHAYVMGDPNAETRFAAFMESLLHDPSQLNPDGCSPSAVTPVDLPGFPEPDFPFGTRPSCLFLTFGHGRIFEGIMRLARTLGDPANHQPEKIYEDMTQRLGPVLSAVDRLETLYTFSRAVDPTDKASIAQFERWFKVMTVQPASLPSAPPQGSPFALPGTDLSPFTLDLCRLERWVETARAVRCVCLEFYRITHIVNLEHRRGDGGELVGEGCPGDLIEIQGNDFGARDWGLGDLRSEVIFAGGSTLGVAVAEEDYVLWSDTRVQVRVPEHASTGMITLRILCRDVDVSECGVQLKLVRGLSADRLFTIPGVPALRTPAGGSARWCEDFRIMVSARDAESVTVRDDDGREVFFPEGAPGSRRAIDGTITVREAVSRTYTLTARNVCHEATTSVTVERLRLFLLGIPGYMPSGEPVTLILHHYCSPEHVGRSEAVFSLTFDDPDEVLVDPPNRLVVAGSHTEESITVSTRPGACGFVTVTAIPEDASAYDQASSSNFFYVFDTPRLTRITVVGANPCDAFRFEVMGDCLRLDPLGLEVLLTRSDGALTHATVLEIVPGRERSSHGVVVLCETPPFLGDNSFTVTVAQFGRTSNSLPLTERPLRIPSALIQEFTSSRMTVVRGAAQDLDLSWTVRHASRIEIHASGGRLGRGPGVIHRQDARSDSFCETWSGSVHDRIGSPLIYELRAYSFTGGEPTTRLIEITDEIPPTPMPTLRGVRLLRIWNCNHHLVHIWMRQAYPTPGVWEEQGALEAGIYDAFGTCQRTDAAERLEVPLEDGVFYELQVVDPSLSTCGGENDPTNVGCQTVWGHGPTGSPLILGDAEGYDTDWVLPNEL
jgi:hypothetical protein